MERKHILLMTATITPQNVPQLARTNPAERLSDYEKAMDFYLGFIGRSLEGIVFVENSHSDVASLRKLVAVRGMTQQVEFLCNYGVNTYAAMGRTYGELKLLDHAMDSSAMVGKLAESGVIWKVTGRYIVKNLKALIRQAPQSFDVYCDMKDRPRPSLDMRVMAWTPRGYEWLFRSAADALSPSEGLLSEQSLRGYLPKRAVDSQLGDRLRWVQRFRCEPSVDGIRGFDNQNYSKGGNLIKFYIRRAGRQMAPWYWL